MFMDKGRNPRVSIILLNYNGLSLLGPLVDKNLISLFNTEYPNFEVVLVDNGSNDNSVDHFARGFTDSRLRIVRLDKNYGWSGANNRAFKYISKSSQYVAFLNNDTIVKPEWLSVMIRTMEFDDKIGAAGPISLEPSGGIDHSGVLIDFSGEPYDFTDELRPTNLTDVFYIPGNCIIIKCDLFKKLEGFDEHYFFNFDETDFCSRAHMAGFRVVLVPQALLYHYKSATAKKTFEKTLSSKSTYYFTRNRFYFILKNYPEKRLLFSLSFALLKNLLGCVRLLLVKRELRQALSMIVGIMAFLKDFRLAYSSRKANKYKLRDSSLFVPPRLLARAFLTA